MRLKLVIQNLIAKNINIVVENDEVKLCIDQLEVDAKLSDAEGLSAVGCQALSSILNEGCGYGNPAPYVLENIQSGNANMTEASLPVMVSQPEDTTPPGDYDPAWQNPDGSLKTLTRKQARALSAEQKQERFRARNRQWQRDRRFLQQPESQEPPESVNPMEFPLA